MQVPNSLLKKYRDYTQVVYLNDDDTDLVMIKVDVLDVIQRTYKRYGFKPPEDYPLKRRIAGYGLEPEDQMFQREQVPDSLLELEKNIRKRPRRKGDTFINRELTTINMFWEELDKNKDFYNDEIAWLQRMWYHRLFGYWFFNNGTPTYITGSHWQYLNWWHFVDGTQPRYRDRDRRWYMAQQFCLVDTTTFVHRDKTGKAIPDLNGEYAMKDTGRRVCMGSNNPKSRRVGDTSKAQSHNTDIATRSMNAHIGIQGKDDDNARNVFTNHFANAFKKYPIFFKPMFSQLDPRTAQVYDYDDPEIGLETTVDFATTADRSAYDGYQLLAYHRDEPGKVKYEDINQAHRVVKQCLALGDEIFGFMFYTTTVDEMNQRGGKNFLELTKGSYWNIRDDNGQTKSGLYTFFFKAWDGLQGFVDDYGMSVIDTPSSRQAKAIGKKQGAKEFLMNRRKQLENDKDILGLSEEKRLYPIKFRECFTPPAQNVFFRNDILEERITELEFEGVEAAVKGDLEWSSGFGSNVIFIPSDEGRFYISLKLKDGETNRKIRKDGIYYPEFPDRGVIGADAFRVEKTEGGKMSDGGIAAFYKRDPNIDIEDDIEKWVSSRFVATYRYRADGTEEYAEDVLKCALYFGYMVYPENNVDVVQRNFIKWGYEGYLLYDTDPATGLLKNNPGCYTQEAIKMKIFNLVRNYVRFHGHRDRHSDLLREILDIPGRNEMTDFDLFTAAGVALVGTESQLGNYLAEQNKDTDDTNIFFPKRKY